MDDNRKEKNKMINVKDNRWILVVVILLIFITVFTNYYGSTDIGDYSDTAKFFAGKYSADIRNSHSYLFGFVHSPLVYLTESFFVFKITSLLFLLLIVYSIYIINGRDKRTLWLMLLSPIVWYMAPWMNPIQLTALLFLWAWHFMVRYEKTEKLSYLVYSGLLIGLGWAFWDTIFYFGVILSLVFLWNKKLSDIFCLAVFVLVGLMPRLILDMFLFNFPFYTILKNIGAAVANLFGGIYDRTYGHTLLGLVPLISVLLAVPLMYWMFYKKKMFFNYTKSMIFLTVSLLFILFVNPQIRYVLTFVPIMVVIVGREINSTQFKKSAIFSIIVIFLFTFPYLLQIGYSVNDVVEGVDFSYLFANGSGFNLDREFLKDEVLNDVLLISEEHPNEVFVVGNLPDSYSILANVYWGHDVKEFVSMQDYQLYLNNESILFEKSFMPIPNIPERRQIWISGGMRKNKHDDTNFDDIVYGIGLGEPIKLGDFEVVDKYKILYLSKKNEGDKEKGGYKLLFRKEKW